jgi:hypothetical protein
MSVEFINSIKLANIFVSLDANLKIILVWQFLFGIFPEYYGKKSHYKIT